MNTPDLTETLIDGRRRIAERQADAISAHADMMVTRLKQGATPAVSSAVFVAQLAAELAAQLEGLNVMEEASRRERRTGKDRDTGSGDPYDPDRDDRGRSGVLTDEAPF